MQKMTKHPCLHGYFKTTTGAATCNYVKNYIVCTQFAKAIRGGKSYTDLKSYDVNNPTQEFQKLFASKQSI